MNNEQIADKLIYDSFGEYTLDDILETLDDHHLLNRQGRDVRAIAWRKIYKGTYTIQDRLERSWDTFSKDVQNFLISHKDEINLTARKFIENKIK